MPLSAFRSSRHLPFPPPAVATRSLLALPLLLAGCHLIDQRTFDPAADRRPVPHFPPAPAAKPPPAPLALVRFSDGADWRPAVTAIVKAALERKPDALFRVDTVVPATGTPEQQAALLASAARTQGVAVASTVQAAGAPPSQIELTGAVEAAVHQVEVRLTAR